MPSEIYGIICTQKGLGIIIIIVIVVAFVLLLLLLLLLLLIIIIIVVLAALGPCRYCGGVLFLSLLLIPSSFAPSAGSNTGSAFCAHS